MALRAAEFRAAYHPNQNWAMGVGIEDPNQYIGAPTLHCRWVSLLSVRSLTTITMPAQPI